MLIVPIYTKLKLARGFSMFFSEPIGSFQKNNFKKKFQYKNQGIPENDLQALLNYVQIKNIVLLIRPVEILAKTLHEEKKYPTKNFNIKGKTSSWGAWASFVPVDQAYSKLTGINSEINEANKEVQACINNGYAVATHLKITEKRFEELRDKKIIFPQAQQGEKYLVIKCPRPHAGISELCYAKKITINSNTEYAIYTANTNNEKIPFQVLSDTVFKRPFIPDYDLLAIFNPWKDFGKDSIRPNPEVTLARRLQKLSPKEQRRSIEKAENFYAREEPNLGNIAPITKKLINELNKHLNKNCGLECIHHNDDAGSPVSKPKVNYPITVLLPQLEGFYSSILVIETTNEFVEFINKINSIGHYRVEANPLWEPAVKWATLSNYFFNTVQLAYYNKNFKTTENALIKMFKSIELNNEKYSKELINLFKLMTQSNLENNVLFSKFFNIVQYSLLYPLEFNQALESPTLEITSSVTFKR